MILILPQRWTTQLRSKQRDARHRRAAPVDRRCDPLPVVPLLHHEQRVHLACVKAHPAPNRTMLPRQRLLHCRSHRRLVNETHGTVKTTDCHRRHPRNTTALLAHRLIPRHSTVILVILYHHHLLLEENGMRRKPMSRNRVRQCHDP